MSWTDEELDQLYRDALKNKSYPLYQDHFFDEVADLLPKKENKKRLFWYFSPLLLAFFFIPEYTTNNELKAEVYCVSEIKNQYIDITKRLKSPANQTDNFTASERGRQPVVDRNDEAYRIDNELVNESAGRSVIDQKTGDLTAFGTVQIAVPQNRDLSPVGRLNYKPKETFHMEASVQALNLKLKNRVSEFSLGTNIGMMEAFIKTPGSKPSVVIDLNTSYRKKYGSIGAEIGLNLSVVLPQKMIVSKESRVYGIRINNYKQQIHYKSVFILEAPLLISKQVNKHSFYLGAAPQFNLGSYFELEKNNTSGTVNKTYFGNRYAMSNFGLKTMIGYSFQLSKRIEAGIQLANYWKSPFNQDELSAELTKCPVVGQITIRKYFKLK